MQQISNNSRKIRHTFLKALNEGKAEPCLKQILLQLFAKKCSKSVIDNQMDSLASNGNSYGIYQK